MSHRLIMLALLLVSFHSGNGASPGQELTTVDKVLKAASAAQRAGHLLEAVKLYGAALDEAKKLGPNDPHVATVLDGLAGLYFQNNDIDKAIEFMKQAVAATEAALGPDHPQVASILSNLATFYEARDQNVEAEECLKRARDIQGLHSNLPVWQRVMLLESLNELYMQQHRYADSEAVLDEAIRFLENSTDSYAQGEHVTIERALAQVYRLEGREDEAKRLMDDVHQGGDQGRHGSPDAAAHGLLQQADEERHAGNDLGAAETHYRQAIADLESLPAPKYSNPMAHALIGLAEICVAKGSDEEAEALFRRALALEEEAATQGYRAQSTARSLTYFPTRLVKYYRDRGRLAELETVYDRVLKVQESVLGADDEAVARTSLKIARLYEEEQKYQQALPYCEQALRIQKRNEGETSQFADTLEGYASLLSKLDREDEASEVRARAAAMRKRTAPPEQNIPVNP